MPEAVIIVGSGVTSTGLVLENADTDSTSLIVRAGGTASNTTVGSNCSLTVLNNGTAHGLVEDGGWVSFEEGAEVTFAPNTFSGIVLNEDQQASVHSGTTAVDVTLNYHGKVAVFSGGLASGLVANSGGSFGVFSGGTALLAIEDGGYVWSEEGATVTFIPNSFTGLELTESASVHSGTTATDTTVNSDGVLWAFSGGLMNGATVNSGGSLILFGGTAHEVMENGGYVREYDDADITFVPNSFSGTVLEGGNQATVHSGTTATDITVNSSGQFHVFSSGILNNAIVNFRGNLYVSSSGILNGATVNSSGNLYVSSSGILNGATVNSGGRLFIHGGVAHDIAINAGGMLDISSGGTAKSATINSGGRLDVEGGGVASKLDIKADGELVVYSGGTATDVDWTPCVGYVSAHDGAVVTYASSYSGVYYGSQGELFSNESFMTDITLGAHHEMYVMDGGAASGITVDDDGEFYVLNGGEASGVTLNAGGWAEVSSGAVATDIVLASRATLLILSSGFASNTTVNTSGAVYLSSGGTATNATVSSGGAFVVLEGGSATGLTVAEGAYLGLEVTPDTYVQGTYAGSALEVADGSITGFTVHSGCWLTASDGGVANDVVVQNGATLDSYEGGVVSAPTINVGGQLLIYGNGIAHDVRENGGNIYGDLTNVTFASNTFSGAVLENFWEMATVHSGTTATGATAKAGGIIVFEGGVASAIALSDTGYLDVSSDGTATVVDVNPGGEVYVSSGGTAHQVKENGGYVSVADGADVTFVSNSFSGLVLDDSQWATVHSGTTAADVTVNAYGQLFVSSGGTATDVAVNMDGTAEASSCGLVDGAVVHSGGSLMIYSGAKLTGRVAFEDGATVIPFVGSILDFDLTRTAPGADALVNDLSVLMGTPTYTLTVDGSVAFGTYSLAGGASMFNKTITVVDTLGAELGALMVGGPDLVNAGVNFSLALDGSDLSVTISANESGVDFSGLLLGRTMQITSDQVASGVDVGSSGTLLVKDGGVASDTTVHSGGSLYVSSGGTALQVKEDGGCVNVKDGADVTFVPNSFSGLVLDDWQPATAHSGTTATDVTVNATGLLLVASGGILNGATVNSRGEVYLSSGGTAINATVSSGGAFAVFEGGSATGLTVAEGAYFDLEVTPDTYVQGTYAGSALEVADGSITGFTVHSGCWLTASDGGVANNVVVQSGATLDSYKGGVVSAPTINVGGRLLVHEKGSACDVRENGGAVHCNVANATFVSNTFSGAVLENWDEATVHSGTTALDATAKSGGSLIVFNGGVASAVALSDTGKLTISSGGTATVVNANPGGKVYVSSGGTATDVAVNLDGTAEASGGLIDGAAVHAGGSLLIYSGAKLTGQMAFEEGATVIPFVGSILDFDLTRTVAGADALVNDLSVLMGTPTYTLTMDGSEAIGTYSLAGGVARFNKTITVVDTLGEELGTLTTETPLVVGDIGLMLNLTHSVLSVTVGNPNTLPTELAATSNEASWTSTGSTQYVVEYSTDNFEHIVVHAVATNSLDTFGLAAGTYQWRVRAGDGIYWADGEEIAVAETDSAPQVVQSDEDGNADLFFARKYDTWGDLYQARHAGLLGGWEGTGDTKPLDGKNRIADVFQGSTDPSLLCLTDDANGDALFVDDIYSELPGTLAEQQARVSQIAEIRAGGGDDIVDLTSQRFAYTGSGLTVRGGLGDDVIWANKGDNWLFGDAGDDSLVGASGNDVLVGGAGDDTLHGGGGDDIFAFGAGWGSDTVEQLADGKVTLWFAHGDESKWDAASLTYTDGAHSVTVSGVAAESVSLKFGDEGGRYSELHDAGAFDAFTGEKIFEDKNKGLLA